MVEGARLEGVYAEKYRGFESPSLRNTRKARELRLFRNVRGYARSVFQTPSDSEESSGRKIVLVP